jgi:thiamine pyrophosphate-dependent acetolactate synthase large subunit-like protein
LRVVETVGELLRDAATGADVAADVDTVAAAFDSVPVPGAFSSTLGLAAREPYRELAPVVPAGRAVVLAGPEVVRAGRVDDLRALAAAGNLPVANTWGAKGVFAWDSPHHMGTCGLQARDFELLGFASYDVIVATGLDPAESPRERFELAPIVEVPPAALGYVAPQITPASEPIRANELYARLSAIAQPGYVDDRVPLHPARAIADLRGALSPGGVVAADPGLAGLWVARTFPTTEPGTVIVPARAALGIAAALALLAALRGLPAIAVTTEPLDHTTLAVLELATRLAAHCTVDVWSAGGPVRRAGDHLGQLQAAAREPGVTIVDVPVDASPTSELVDAAGPVIAWDGLTVGPSA